MKCPLLPFLATIIFSFHLHAADSAAVTQQDIRRMLELKIPENTIVGKVKGSGTAFVLGAEDITRLKKAGASDALIAAMQASRATAGGGLETSEITDLALIVDYSGSMNAKMKDGATKVASAKICVSNLIDKLPKDLNVALIVYGTSKQRGCKDIDVIQPLGLIDRAALKAKIMGFNATGMTPIAGSLEIAGEELKKAKGGAGIVLVTDGAESCHGDPAAVAARLSAEFGVKFGISVIGFGIEPKEQAELADIAAKGHGKLLTVENADELANALKKVVEEKVAVAPKQRETKAYEAGGVAVKPGVFLGDAPLAPSGDYKGELAMKEAKYYQVMLHKGQELRAIGIVQKTPYQASNSNIHQTFVVAVYNKDLAQVAREKSVVEGNPTDPVSLRAAWTADVDGPAYIAIAASDNHNNDGTPVEVYPDGAIPKPSPYTLKIKIEGEAEGAGEPTAAVVHSKKAAGGGFNAAAKLTPPELTTTDLKLGEAAFYKFPVKKGDVVQASAAVQKPWYCAGNSVIAATYTLTLYDDDQVQVGQKKIAVKKNPPEAQTLSVTWPATLSGNAYLCVSAANSGQDIYPANFEPSPGRVSVQVTAGDTSAATEGTAEKPKPKSAKDPFAGAEGKTQ